MHLKKLLERRLSRLQVLKDMERAIRTKPWREQDLSLLYVGVEGLNLWTQFCKTYVIECCRGVKNLSGATWKSPSFVSRDADDIILHLSIHHGRARAGTVGRARFNQQPNWRDLPVVHNCCTTLNIGNLGDIRLAQGLQLSFQRELAPIRNFAAHKSLDTRLQVDQLLAARGYLLKSDLPSVMLAPGIGAPTLASQWFGEMETAMTLMCG